MERLARNSFSGSFMDNAEKASYLGRFDAEAAKLRTELIG
jgi:adenosine deaminase